MAESVRASDDIRIEQRGGVVIVTLNRPRALNALSFDMCRAMHDGLARWQADPAVQAVVIKGAGERAFCAGGDIRGQYDVLTSQGVAPAHEFYAREYFLIRVWSMPAVLAGYAIIGWYYGLRDVRTPLIVPRSAKWCTS